MSYYNWPNVFLCPVYSVCYDSSTAQHSLVWCWFDLCMCVLCVQENLLQSVLPVYISMKMKLAILERLQDCKDKEDQQRLVKDKNFHSLYVKRHENVR